MKFFTKKAKIVLLVILLVGAVLLAYNSLNHEIEYLDLNPHLGNSLITEGFTEKRKCRHKHHSKMDCPYYRRHHEELEEEMEELEEEEQSYANTNSYANSDSYDRFNTAFNNYGNPLNSNHIMNSFDYSNGGLLSGKTKKSAKKNDKKEMPKSQIPPGSEDLYILKSEIVPPVCPVCPSVTPCPNKPVPPCPACARCPEPSFECKKVPNYSNNHDDFLPMPVLNDFSTFGM
jgi:hypothetical protein